MKYPYKVVETEDTEAIRLEEQRKEKERQEAAAAAKLEKEKQEREAAEAKKRADAKNKFKNIVMIILYFTCRILTTQIEIHFSKCCL